MTVGYFKIVLMIYSIFESARDSRFEKYLGQYQIRFYRVNEAGRYKINACSK